MTGWTWADISQATGISDAGELAAVDAVLRRLHPAAEATREEFAGMAQTAACRLGELAEAVADPAVQLLKAVEDVWAGHPELGNAIINQTIRDPAARADPATPA